MNLPPRLVQLSAVVGLLTAFHLHAQEARPEKAAPSAMARVDRFMAAYGPHTPGAALGVVENGELVFAKGYGQANLEYNKPITPKTVFYLASVGKQFTAFAIALLAAEGKLALDEPVQKYIPEFPDFGRPVTVRQLTHHTSGLRDTNGLLSLAGVGEGDLLTQQDLLDVILAQRELNFAPGTEHLYSNSGYTLLATIVERVAGQTFRRFMEERVFQPLGMTSSFVADEPGQVIPRRADSYAATDQGHFREVVRPYAAYGSGGIYSTVEDLARWLANLDTKRVGPEAVRRMSERGVLASGETIDYAFGLDTMVYRGLQLIGHDGTRAGYRAYAGRLPGHGLGVIALGNVASFDACAASFELMDAFLELPEESQPTPSVPTPAARLEAYEGDYVRQGGGWNVRFTVEEGKLHARFEGLSAELTPRTKDRFELDVPCIVSGSVQFDREPDGRIERGKFLGSTVRRVEQPLHPWRPDGEELARYAGQYYSPELETAYTLVVRNSQLVARHPGVGEVPLTPKGVDSFEGGKEFFRHVTFTRAETGDITDMLVSGFRVLNVRFERRE